MGSSTVASVTNTDRLREVTGDNQRNISFQRTRITQHTDTQNKHTQTQRVTLTHTTWNP